MGTGKKWFLPARLAQCLGWIRYATKDREQENELEHYRYWRKQDGGSRVKKSEKQENKVHVEKTGGKLDKRMKTSHREGSFRGGWMKEHIKTPNRRQRRKQGYGIPTRPMQLRDGGYLNSAPACSFLRAPVS